MLVARENGRNKTCLTLMGIIQAEAEVMMQKRGENEWCPWGLD